MESNDQKFDKLIEKSLAREKFIAEINGRIMKEVRRAARRRRVKMWCRVVTFALFVPISIVAFIAATRFALNFFGDERGVVVAAMIVITGIVTELRLVANFSPYEV